jgi:lysophospholipase L1-like esterase
MVAAGEIDYETVYWERLRKKILAIRNYTPVNVINAAIGGSSAVRAIPRLESQVLCHNPDLIIVCFGLNDVNGTLEDYLSSLNEIFRKALASGAEVIFLTPNMLNTYVAEDTEARWLEYAAKTAAMQNGGRMDLYIESAVALARELGVTVCDAYAEWKCRAAAGEDTTMLLANRINHPTKEMHALFAELLFDAIMQNDATRQGDESTMYQ